MIRVAAYQAPLQTGAVRDTVARIRAQVERCEELGVDILCCPEAVLGGLADYYGGDVNDIALDVESGQLADLLSPLSSSTVTTVVGFSERRDGALYNSAAVLHGGAILGVYRKMHPAINRSVYQAGDRPGVFTVNGLTIGIAICYDSNFPDLVRQLKARGARVLFIPGNNALPANRKDVVALTRSVDVSLARANRLAVVRTDVSGRTAELVSYGTSAIVAPDGAVLQFAPHFTECLLTAELNAGRVAAGANHPTTTAAD